MYDRAFIDRYKNKLDTSVDFAAHQDIRAALMDICITSVFTRADATKIEGKADIFKAFNDNCKAYFIARLMTVLPDPAQRNREIKNIDAQMRILDEIDLYQAALDLFFENTLQECNLDQPGLAVDANGLKIA